MKHLRALKNAVLLVPILLLNSVSLAGHAAAMPTMSHEMGGMSHAASDSSSCATQCRTAVFNKEDTVASRHNEQEDDEPVVPFYVQVDGWRTYSATSKEQLYAAKVKPPPKIPIYIRYGVFRV